MLIKISGIAILILTVTILLFLLACIKAAGRADKLMEKMKWR